MIFTRSDFYQHIFEPYNKAVKNGKYVKIEYKLWRTLRDWCCDDQWYNFEIVVDPINGGYNLYLRDDLRITPEVITMARTAKKDFTKYLEDKVSDYWQFDLEFQKKLSEQLTTISNSKIYCYDDTLSEISYNYDALTHYDDTYNLNPITIKEKENNNMKFNFEFGPVDSSVRMSLYGMAIKNASGTYVAYDKATNQIMDVDIFNFEGANKFVYKMPVAISDIAVGDVIVHQRVPMHVMELPKSKNYIVAIDPYHGERKEIMLTKSPFGFDFITKVVSLVDFTNSANAANPFGNLLPLLLMGDNKTDDMLPLLFMMNGQNGLAQNPMLMYALMNKGGKMDDLLPLMLMCGSPVLPTGVNGKNADSTNE